MAFITTTFKLDLTPGASRQVIHASQGDIGRPFKAELYWNGTHFDADDYDALLRGKKVDATVFEYDTPVIDGYYVTFYTAEQMTIISGPVECELVFSNDGDIIASANFVLMVEDSPYNPDALSESDIPTIGDLIEQTIGGDIRDEVDALIEENPELMLQDNAVTTPKLAPGAVTTAKLADGAVTREKLADNITDFLPLEYTKTRYTGTAGTTTVWYAIIPAEYKPRLVLANDTVNTVEEPQKLGGRETATIAVNAGLFSTATSETRGYIINNSEVIKDTNYTAGSSSQYLYMESNGTLKAVSENVTINQLSALNPVWAFHGWYPVVQDGVDLSDARDNTSGMPRTFVGQDTSGNYIVFVASGRMDNEAGFSMKDGVEFCPAVGFTPYILYNLDGGGSSAFVYKGVRVSEIVEGENRPVANFLVWGKDPAKLPDSAAAASVASGENIDVQKYLYENVYSMMKLPLKIKTPHSQGVQTTDDLNTLFKGGIYKIDATMNGSPLSDYGFVLVVRDDNKMINQLAFNKTELFIRQLWLNNDGTSATPSAWKQYGTSETVLDLSNYGTAPTVEINRVYKSANTVTAYFSLTLQEAVSDYGIIATIPSGYEPPNFQYLYFWSGITPVVGYIQPSGQIHIRKSGGLASGSKIQGFATYVRTP